MLTVGLGISFTIITIAILNLHAAANANAANMVMTNGRFLVRNNQSFTVKGMNYYPQNHAWERFWLDYEETAVSEQINTELNLAQNLGINTVRLFVPYNLFSGTVTSEYPAYLADFIVRLQQRDMVAIVTLFDYYPSQAQNPYHPTNYAVDKQHIQTIIQILGPNNPTILAWDIKNEMDLDYAAFGESIVKAWANEMINYTRAIDPNHLITIGFNGAGSGTFDPDIVAEMATAVDLVSFHYYQSESAYQNNVQVLQTAIGSKPLILEEFGLHTQNSGTKPHTESEQAAYYNAILALSEANNLAGTIFWTLNDFSQIPNGLAETEKCLGILRNNQVMTCEIANPENYSSKPAADVIRIHYQPYMAYADLFNGLVDMQADAPPAGWSDDWYQGGGLFRGYNPSNPLWSHSEGQIAFTKFVSQGTSITGVATSPILHNVNIDHTPFLSSRITTYTIRDTVSGHHSYLTIGIDEAGKTTELMTLTTKSVLPQTVHLDLRQPPLSWSGTHTFQIKLGLHPSNNTNGYSASYQFDWLVLEGHKVYLPIIHR